MTGVAHPAEAMCGTGPNPPSVRTQYVDVARVICGP